MPALRGQRVERERGTGGDAVAITRTPTGIYGGVLTTGWSSSGAQEDASGRGVFVFSALAAQARTDYMTAPA